MITNEQLSGLGLDIHNYHLKSLCEKFEINADELGFLSMQSRLFLQNHADKLLHLPYYQKDPWWEQISIPSISKEEKYNLFRSYKERLEKEADDIGFNYTAAAAGIFLFFSVPIGIATYCAGRYWYYPSTGIPDKLENLKGITPPSP